jgi:hypothetical protein
MQTPFQTDPVRSSGSGAVVRRYFVAAPAGPSCRFVCPVPYSCRARRCMFGRGLFAPLPDGAGAVAQYDEG